MVKQGRTGLTMIQTEFNLQALMLVNEKGQFRLATGVEIIKAAQQEISNQFSRGITITSPSEVKDYLQLQFVNHEHEIFGVLWLDNRHRIISFEELFRGTIDGAAVYPREVVKSALSYNAAACILYHNHPSGISEPSHSDENITSRLKEALSLVDVRTLDHFIIGEQIYSFAEHGLL
jgi:DNA repair protein RadC